MSRKRCTDVLREGYVRIFTLSRHLDNQGFLYRLKLLDESEDRGDSMLIHHLHNINIAYEGTSAEEGRGNASLLVPMVPPRSRRALSRIAYYHIPQLKCCNCVRVVRHSRGARLYVEIHFHLTYATSRGNELRHGAATAAPDIPITS